MIEYGDLTLESILYTIAISLFVASPFLIASIISKEYRHPLRLRADLASFSAGIFIGAVTFSIIEESIKLGDIYTLAFGFGIGATTFSITRYLLQRKSYSKGNNYVKNLSILIIILLTVRITNMVTMEEMKCKKKTKAQAD